MSHIIIGTAGHIDHGKTSLVYALTGVDTDRLREEKERGLTIDIGFARFSDKASIIDVPGHEKFIRNMVAGVSTVDLVLLIVAADDGVMPQTREHLDILKILQVRDGIIVITKRDMVDDEWLDLVMDEARSLTEGSFLETAEIVCVSSTTGAGIAELKSKIESKCEAFGRKAEDGVFWMPIDRSFTMKGFGTVVTGSVLAGHAMVGKNLELLPQKRTVKVRGLQSHGTSVTQVASGDRAAVNMQAVDKQQVGRGDVLAAPGYFSASRRFDAKLQLLESAPRALKHRTRVRVHLGTAEIMARIALINVESIEPGAQGYVQLHLEHAAVARRLDPFVIRQYSPTITVGGGIILDANAQTQKRTDPAVALRMASLESADPETVIEQSLLASPHEAVSVESLATLTTRSLQQIQQLIDRLMGKRVVVEMKKQGRAALMHKSNLDRTSDDLTRAFADFHRSNPAKLGVPKAEVFKLIKELNDGDLIHHLIEELKAENVLKEAGGIISLRDHQPTLSSDVQRLKSEIADRLFEEGFATSSPDDLSRRFDTNVQKISEVLSIMIDLGEVIRVEGNIYFHPQRVEDAKQHLLQLAKEQRELTVGEFKNHINASRKYAMPLLNYFDGTGITQRVGDVRVLSTDS